MVLKFYPVLELWGDAIIVFMKRKDMNIFGTLSALLIWDILIFGHVGLAIYTTESARRVPK